MASAIWKFPWGPLVAESGLSWGVSWGVWRVIYFGLQEAFRGRRGDLQGPMDREQFDIEYMGNLCTLCDMYVAGSAALRTAPTSTRRTRRSPLESATESWRGAVAPLWPAV